MASPSGRCREHPAPIGRLPVCRVPPLSEPCVNHTQDPPRPDPDALLATTRSGGALRIFLGAAPGVGKTSAMLHTARERHDRGEEVVLGVIEAHGRAETEQLCAGLERLAPITRDYRGRGYPEFDLDTALARRPAILLVDELAHRLTGCL